MINVLSVANGKILMLRYVMSAREKIKKSANELIGELIFSPQRRLIKPQAITKADIASISLHLIILAQPHVAIL